jgi:dethiobiotin synthetase
MNAGVRGSGGPEVRRSALAVVGTDTGIGKTHVSVLLVRALRAAGRRVWIHKPIACGGWRDGTAEDGRALAALCGDGQPPETICPRQFPGDCAPHLAAAAAGARVTLDELVATAQAVRAAAPCLILETAGGLLAPLTHDRRTNADLLAALALPIVVVARPNLGTLNHTALTVRVAQQRGLDVRGLIVNAATPVADPAAAGIAAELTAMTGVPVLAELAFGAEALPAGVLDAFAFP